MSDMSAPALGYIVDAPLPMALNFNQLKAAGIEQLQQQVGTVWTNYNDSDPGVTILEQLCYALTELGYCAQMPIADVLTKQDGKIAYQDQFFAPQAMLTTSPITIDDYRKLIHDHVPEVRAVYIISETWNVQIISVANAPTTEQIANGRYKVYVAFNDDELPQRRKYALLRTIDYLLQEHRNIGEFFYRSRLLHSQKMTLKGKVYLAPTEKYETVLEKIQQAIRNYEVPLPQRSGFSELQGHGLSTDQIMNGPMLKNGWISSVSALGEKCTSVSTNQLAALIGSIDGVSAVESLVLVTATLGAVVTVEPTKVPKIDFLEKLQFIQNRQVLRQATQGSNFVLGDLQATHLASGIAAEVDAFPELPQGRFRDIESYFSIQNTFPDMYGVGANSLESNAPNYRVASARQLKAYLLFYDQMLANEFSQLAHVAELFSFVPQQTTLGQSVLESSINYKPFCTTYFCQDLYAVPDVKPLLRGNDMYQYQSDTTTPAAQIEAQAWERYKAFPFNEYIHGLRECMEDAATANQRRDQLLSHLMARHGEDAVAYEAMMSAYQSFGSQLETRIVVKSQWLLNLEILSYYRMKAVNWCSPNTLAAPGDPRFQPARNWLPMTYHDANDKTKPKIAWWLREFYPVRDGELDQDRFFKARRLADSTDVNNVNPPAVLQDFSTFEYKLDILLGLSTYFLGLAGKLFGLVDDVAFLAWLDSAGSQDVYYHADLDVSVLRHSVREDRLFQGHYMATSIDAKSASNASNLHQASLAVDHPPSEEKLGLMQVTLPSFQSIKNTAWQANYRAHAEQLLWLATQRKACLLLEHQLLLARLPEGIAIDVNFMEMIFSASLLMPSYVTVIQQDDLKNYLATLCTLHWPSHIKLHFRPMSFAMMKASIAAFLQWFNANKSSDKAAAAKLLVKLLQLPSVGVTS